MMTRLPAMPHRWTYTNYIKERNDWNSLASTPMKASRLPTRVTAMVLRMVRDAMDGKIDLIVTKSVSRFARNTVDSLTTVRKLKDKGIEIYFEKRKISGRSMPRTPHHHHEVPWRRKKAGASRKRHLGPSEAIR